MPINKLDAIVSLTLAAAIGLIVGVAVLSSLPL
jgi:hypothetical protein